MSEEMAERLLAVLERIAVQLEQRPVTLGPHPGVWGHISAPPQLPQFYPAIMPRADCGCPSPGVCMTVSCPRKHMSLGISTAAANP